MTVDSLTVHELISKLQNYYGAGLYSEDDVDVWVDEFGKHEQLFLGCLFIAVRRLHSKTYKTLPDVAIAMKAKQNACEIYSQVEKALSPTAIEEREYISDEERAEIAEGLRELREKLLSGKCRARVFHSVEDV